MSSGYQSGYVASIMSPRTGLAGWLETHFKMALVAGDPAAVGAAWVLRGTVPRSTQAA